MATLSWTDGTGAATLTTDWPLAIRRFTGWRALPAARATVAEALTGRTYAWRHADLYDATFVFDDIDNADQPLVMRLLRHCATNGEFAVATNDSAARSYPTVQVVGDGNQPTAEQDPVSLRWRVTFPRVRNVDASPVEMLAIYA